jgi:predicted MFS family arabinose efflux permease
VAARAPYSLLATLLFVRLADEWFGFFPAGALESIRADLDLSYAEAGLILAALPAGGFVGNGFAVAADFVDRRLLAGLGALVFALCMAVFALAGSLPVLLVAAFVWGAASDAFTHGCEVALVDLYRDDLAPVLGRVNAYGAVGDLLGPLTLAAAAALGIGWRSVFLFGAVLMLLYTAWIAGQTFPKPQPPQDAPTPIAAVLDVVRDRRIILLAVADGLFGLLDEPFLGFAIAFLERERALTAAAATTIASTAVAAGILGFLVVPVFTRRLAAGPLLMVLATLLALAIPALIVAPVVPLQIAAAFVFGFGGATFYAVLQATYLGLRPGQAGTSQAVISTFGLLGIGFPALAGVVSDSFGLTAGLGLYAAIPLGILLVLALGGIRRL